MQRACDSGNVGEVGWRTEEHDCGIERRLCYKKTDVDYKYRSMFVMRESSRNELYLTLRKFSAYG